MELTRGDTLKLKFKRQDKNTGEIIKQKADKVYFTVKENYNLTNYVFQKSLSAGTITYSEEDNCYYFIINPEDTNELNYMDYVYDIEVIQNGEVRTVTKGILKITEEVTYAENEV